MFSPSSELSSYDEFARDQILQLPFAVSLPEEGSVFDYYLDLKSYQFLPWSERRQEGRDTGGYIALPEVWLYSVCGVVHVGEWKLLYYVEIYTRIHHIYTHTHSPPFILIIAWAICLHHWSSLVLWTQCDVSWWAGHREDIICQGMGPSLILSNPALFNLHSHKASIPMKNQWPTFPLPIT